MRTLLLSLALLSSLGCNPHPQPYTPVDWNSHTQPTNPTQPTPQPIPIPQTIPQQLLELHNHQRNLKGRPDLILDESLNQYAQKWADHMAQTNRLTHSNLNFVNQSFMTGGENIAWNQQDPQEVTQAWMNSPGHRDNILNRRFTKAGFGLAYHNGQPYWCAVFGG